MSKTKGKNKSGATIAEKITNGCKKMEEGVTESGIEIEKNLKKKFVRNFTSYFKNYFELITGYEFKYGSFWDKEFEKLEEDVIEKCKNYSIDNLCKWFKVEKWQDLFPKDYKQEDELKFKMEICELIIKFFKNEVEKDNKYNKERLLCKECILKLMYLDYHNIFPQVTEEELKKEFPSDDLVEEIREKSTHNRRERPVYGHCGWSRGRFYYRITTFEGRPWDARDPHKTTFMALKHAIRLSIWRKQKETPGVEKAPGVSSPQRKGYGELRFGVRPGHPRKAVTSISQAEALAHGLTHLHHLVFAAVLARELDWCAALQDAREDARPWGVVGIGLRSDVWVEVRRDDHRPAVLVTRVDDVVDMPHDVIGAAVRPQVVDDEEVILEEARLRVLALVERHRLDVGHDVLHAGLQRGEPEVDDPVGDCRGIERLTCAHLSPEEQPIHVIA